MDASTSPPQLLWEHADPKSTRTHQFKAVVEEKYNVVLTDYEALRQWSIAHLAQFWEEVWRFTGIRAATPYIEVYRTVVMGLPRECVR